MIHLFDVFMAPEASRRVTETLVRNHANRLEIGMGAKVRRFEHELQRILWTEDRPVVVNSCTSAITLALHLLDVKGKDVISTPMTCAATNTAILHAGGNIIWADIYPDTGLINPIDVHRKITKNTAAIMAVDWGGRLADYRALKNLGYPVIQDAAHSFMAGSSLRGNVPKGDYQCYSFGAIKHLTCGDGGALVVPLRHLERARKLRWYGMDRESDKDFRCEQNIYEPGFKYIMNDIAATIGLANIGYVGSVVEDHQQHASIFDSELRGISDVLLPPTDFVGSWWLYTVLVHEPAHFIKYMASKDIEASPVHVRNDLHTAMPTPPERLPGVDVFASNEVAIPVGWWLTDQEIEAIVKAVREYRPANPNSGWETIGG